MPRYNPNEATITWTTQELHEATEAFNAEEQLPLGAETPAGLDRVFHQRQALEANGGFPGVSTNTIAVAEAPGLTIEDVQRSIENLERQSGLRLTPSRIEPEWQPVPQRVAQVQWTGETQVQEEEVDRPGIVGSLYQGNTPGADNAANYQGNVGQAAPTAFPPTAYPCVLHIGQSLSGDKVIVDNGTTVFVVTADGNIRLGDGLNYDEAAKLFLEALGAQFPSFIIKAKMTLGQQHCCVCQQHPTTGELKPAAICEACEQELNQD
ncbi:MAG TPA: hypothetical protein VFR24_27520 [Candidatus Angelobacter sp.]|nr:hypothetical protein [Candidatus Angelobacter sp.]